MKNRTVIALLALSATAGSALAQGLHPVSDVRTVEAATTSSETQETTHIVVEVPTLDRLQPFQRFVINPHERQNDPARFEIRVDGTIRNYARVTNGFVRAQRYVADRARRGKAGLAARERGGHLARRRARRRRPRRHRAARHHPHARGRQRGRRLPRAGAGRRSRASRRGPRTKSRCSGSCRSPAAWARRRRGCAC